MKEPNIIKKDDIENKGINNQKKVLILSILCMVILLISSSYALMTNFTQKNDAITFSTGNLEMTILNGEETFSLINLNNRLPESDDSGLSNATAIPIIMKNTGTMTIGTYDVKLVSSKNPNKVSTLSDEYIRFSVSLDNVTYSTPASLADSENIIFSANNLEVEDTKTIYLKIWGAASAGKTILDQTYFGSLSIDLEQQYTPPAPTITNISDAGFGKITFTVEDSENETLDYCINQESENITTCTWYGAVVGEQTTEEYVTSSGIYYIHVKDEEGNVGHSSPLEMTITYNLLDYIESTGTQYINTEYYWQNENIEIYYDGIVTKNASSQSLFGNEEYTTSSGSTRNFAGIPYGANGSYSIYLGSGVPVSVSVSIGVRFTLNIKTTTDKKIELYKDDVLTKSATYSGSVKTRDTAYVTTSTKNYVGTIFIFSNHNSSRGSSNAGSQIISGMKLYRFKLTDNNVLKRDYIPVERISDGVVGLYDQVEKKFYGNAGSGTFTKGTRVGVL